MTGQVFSSLMHAHVVRPRDDLAKAFKRTLVENADIAHLSTPNRFQKVCNNCRFHGYGHLKHCLKVQLLRNLEKIMGYFDTLEATEFQKNIKKQSFILGLEKLDSEELINFSVDQTIKDIESGTFEGKMAEIKAEIDARPPKDRIQIGAPGCMATLVKPPTPTLGKR